MFLTGLPRVLDAAGVPYTLTDGWKTRSIYAAGITQPRAVFWHTTETADATFSRSPSAAPTLNYVIRGKGYPSYNMLIGRDGRVHVIAAGATAHAGYGSIGFIPRDRANHYSFGISFDANENRHPVTPAQLETGARLGAAIDREWKGSIRHVMHGEWAPTRRRDPTRIPGGWPALRAAIQRGHWATRPKPTPPPAPQPTPKPPVSRPAPTPTVEKDWFTMATAAELRTIVRDEIDAALAEKTVTWTDSITKETRQVSLAQAMTYASIHWSRETDRDAEAVADSE